jgi:hypothetical protein
MRNTWFPRKMADYATSTTLEDLKKADTVPERDASFGSRQERQAARAAQAEAQAQAQVAPREEEELPVELPLLSVRPHMISGQGQRAIANLLLQPQEATNVISKFVPQNIDFYRTPIVPEPAEPQPLKRVSPSIPANSAISAAAAERHAQEVEPVAQGKTGIYGSVSTSDIAANVQAMLAEVYDGAPIVLSPESISFIEKTEEGNRVKHLGTFAIEIRLSGAVKGLRRTITVIAQE